VNEGDGIRVVHSSNVGATEFVAGNGGCGISLQRVENFSFEGPVLENTGDGARVVRSTDVQFGSLFESDVITDNGGSGVGIYRRSRPSASGLDPEGEGHTLCNPAIIMGRSTRQHLLL
jgi:hypothetical protein